ncbi:MAG: PAS domain-containing protein [Parvibaculum sp.]|nr:PAS domain-containing protein [Parvibaculum sp.]
MTIHTDNEPAGHGINISVVEVDAPAHPWCRRLLDHWRLHLQPDGLMTRADFNPLDMPRLMGGMFVVEPLEGGADMRYRLVGGDNERRLGRKFTGERFSACYGQHMAAEQIAFHNRVMADKRPACLRGHWVGVDLDHAHFEAIYLPVRAATDKIQVIGGMYDLAGYL